MSVSISQPFIQSGQFPVDGGTRFLTLADMKVVGNNPFTYYEDMIVRCIENHKNYIWREVESAGESGGVMDSNYVYPQGANAGGIDYSGREFNFFVNKEESESPVKENVVYVGNKNEFLSALFTDNQFDTVIIVLTNDIVIDGLEDINIADKHFIVANTGSNKNRLVMNNAAKFIINGQKNQPIEVFAPLQLSESQGSTAIFGGNIWLRFRSIIGASSLTIESAVKLEYEYIDSRIATSDQSSDTISQIYWDNTNKTKQFSLPQSYILVTTNQELVDALELDVSNKSIIICDSITLDNQTITYRGNNSIIDNGITGSIGFGISGPVTFNANSFNRRIEFLSRALTSTVSNLGHVTRIGGDGLLYFRSINGNAELQLQDSIRVEYEYIQPTLTLTNNSTGTVQQNYWHNTNKTSPTVGLTTEQLNTLNSLVTSSDNTIPIKSSGLYTSSGIRRLDDGSLLAPKNFGIESGSILFGDLVKLSEVSGFLAITNLDILTQFALLDTRFDKNFGSYRPRFFNLTSGESNIVIQSSDSNQITETSLIMPINVTNNVQVNSFIVKIFNDCTNVRAKLTNDSSGVVFKYIPNKDAWLTGQGGYNLSGTTVQEISLLDTQLRLIDGENFTLEIVGDSINLLGNGARQPYLEVKAQSGEFTELKYELTGDTMIASEGPKLAKPNTYISVSLSGSNGTITLPQTAKNGDIVRLHQLVNIGNNSLEFIAPAGQSIVYQRVDGTQAVDTSLVVNQSIQIEFIKDGNTWRFYHKF